MRRKRIELSLSKAGVTAVVAAVLLPALAVAQPERPGPGLRPERVLSGKFWKIPAVQERLGLERAQVEALEGIFLEEQKRLIDLKAEVEKGQLDLEAVMSDYEAEEGQIVARIERLEAARAELGKARAMLIVKQRKVLTVEQRRLLEEMAREFVVRRLRHRPPVPDRGPDPRPQGDRPPRGRRGR